MEMSDNKFFSLLWRTAAIAIVALAITAASCSVIQSAQDNSTVQEAIKQGVDPVKAECALAMTRDMKNAALLMCGKV